MDVAFLVDNTGSMDGAIGNVKKELAEILSAIETSSKNDYRLALVTFKDEITVIENFATANRSSIQSKILALSASGGSGLPEASDEALDTVVNTRTKAAADTVPPAGNHQNIDFSPAYRTGVVKIAILVTDAPPGGFDDNHDAADNSHAHNVAVQAAAQGIKIAAIFVPTSGDYDGQKAIMKDYANTTGGVFGETAPDGTGTGTVMTDIIGVCGEQKPPVADAGPIPDGDNKDGQGLLDTTKYRCNPPGLPNNIIKLDGTGSFDPDSSHASTNKGIEKWEWDLDGDGQFDDATGPTPDFTCPSTPGTLTIKLQVTDDEGKTGTDSAQLIVNSSPLVNAGSDKTVHVKSGVTLNGSAPDPDGDDTTCEWTVISKPAGSQPSFSDPTKLDTTFIPDIVDTQDASNPNRMNGTYVAKLTCTDSFSAKGEDAVTITATNDRPNADAGSDRPALQCDYVQLNGTGSFDPDGDKLSYRWELLSAPNSKTVLLAASSPQPKFLADAEGSYIFKLTVNDGTSAPNAEDFDEVTITAVSNPLCAVKPVVTDLDLLFNELDHGLYETLIAINNGRKLLSQRRSNNLVDESITNALTQIDLMLATFAELKGLIDQLHEQLGDALGTIQAMLENPDLTPTQVANLTKTKLKVETIELLTAEISNELESLQDRIDDGEPGEDPADDLKETLQAAQDALAGADLDATRDSLNAAYKLTRTALRESKRLVRKKKLLIKSLIGAEAALRRATATAQNETVSTLPVLRELGKGFAISETVHGAIWFHVLEPEIKTLRVQMYAMNGRLVFTRQAPGAELLFEGLDAQGTPLTNGVYLVVLRARRADGSEVASQIQKIVWLK
jgi:uncharacterized protein YegL